MTTVECIWNAKAILGEGPLWHEETASLYWVDIKSSRFYRLNPGAGEKTLWDLPEALCCFAPRRAGGFVGATERRVGLVDMEGKLTQPLATPEDTLPGNRFNDGCATPDGSFWFGSMDNGEESATGSLYRLAPDGQVFKFDNGAVVTNGPDATQDGRTLYFTNTTKRQIFAFDLAPDGTLSNKRLHIQLSEEDGYPDGMTLDTEGCLWVCTFWGWGIKRFSPTGERIGEIRLPVSNVTCCTFGGPDYRQLYITTARWALNEQQQAEQPLAGGLFVCEPGAQGFAPSYFEG